MDKILNESIRFLDTFKDLTELNYKVIKVVTKLTKLCRISKHGHAITATIHGYMNVES